MGLFIEGKPGDFLHDHITGLKDTKMIIGTYTDPDKGVVCDVLFDTDDALTPWYLCYGVSEKGMPRGHWMGISYEYPPRRGYADTLSDDSGTRQHARSHARQVIQWAMKQPAYHKAAKKAEAYQQHKKEQHRVKQIDVVANVLMFGVIGLLVSAFAVIVLLGVVDVYFLNK